MIKTICCLTFFCISPAVLMGQWVEANGIRAVSGDLDLNQNSITALAESREGRVWIGTQDGLHRMTSMGVEWIQDPALSPLDHVFVSSLLFDDLGRLWVGTLSDGIYVIHEQAIVLHINQDTGLSSNQIEYLIEDSQGRIYIGTASHLHIWTTQLGQAESFVPMTKDGQNTMWKIRDGELLFRKSGMGFWSPTEIKINQGSQVFGVEKGVVVSSSREAFYLDQSHHMTKLLGVTELRDAVQSGHILWLAPLEGKLLQYDLNNPQNPIRKSLKSFDPQPILSLLIGADKTVWIGTGLNGLFNFHATRKTLRHFYHQPAENAISNQNHVRGFALDEDQGLWLGTDGAGVLRFPKFTPDSLQQPVQVGGLPNMRVWSLHHHRGTVWAGTNNGLAAFSAKDQKFIVLPDSLGHSVRCQTSKGETLLYGTFGQGLFSYRDGNLQPFEMDSKIDPRILAIHATDDGIWIGTLNGLWHKQGDQFRRFPEFRQLMIRHLYQQDDVLWVGTSTGLFQNKNGAWKQWTTADGLPNDMVYSVGIAPGGHVWCATNRGMAFLKGQEIYSFQTLEGAQANEFNGGAFIQSEHGLFFGGVNGFNVIHSSPAFNPGEFPKIMFDRLETHQIDQVLDGNTSSIEIPQGSAYFKVSFSSSDHSQPERSLFKYRLIGFEDTWRQPDRNAFAVFTNIPSGHYELEVMACNPLNNWPSRGHILQIRVIGNPLWSQTAKRIYLTLFLTFFLLVLGMTLKLFRSKNIIRESEQRLNAALWGSGDGLWDWDLKHSKVFRTRFDEWLGYQPEEVNEPVHFKQLIHPDDLDQMNQRLERHLSGNSPYYEAVYRIKSSDGLWKWVLDRGRVTERDGEGKPLRMSGTHRDIGREMEVQEQLKLASRAIDATEEAVVILNAELLIVSVNPAFEEIVGENLDQVNLQPLQSLFAEKKQPQIWIENIHDRGAWKGELWLNGRNGPFLAMASINAVMDDQRSSQHYVLVFSDITQRKQTEEELRYLANFDPLTKLPNRTQFLDRLKRAVLRLDRTGKKCGLMFIDLDRFKQINDSLGHKIGDELLKQVSKRLVSYTRKDDTVARLGGDEFTIILERLQKAEDANIVAKKIIKGLAKPFMFGPYEMVISPSIGISIAPDDTSNPEALLQNADTAMYAAKAHGRNTYQFYSSEFNATSLQKLEQENALRRALDLNQLELHYQPQLNLQDGTWHGVEALVRWKSDRWGMVSPADFIPIAEETGFIVPMGEWIIEQALTDFQKWQKMGLQMKKMAVNISPRQLFSNDFLPRIKSLLEKMRFDPNNLELELTESMLLDVSPHNIQTLKNIKSLGVHLALDDFGTGFSSLSYLRKFPISILKIDRSFVMDADESEESRTLVQSIVAMATRLNLTVVAEGIENRNQLTLLEDEGCQLGQGYFFSKPLPAEKLIEWARQQAST